MAWLWLIVGILMLAALLYWQLILAEGAYLGRKIVALLYDWSANIYDRIKAYDPGYEQWFLGLPLSRALALQPAPLLLDVATGTARLARTLFAQPGYRGRIIGLDYSRKMLEQATEKTQTWANRITFVWQDASQLPFPDNTFDAVTCLEALEFMPDADQVLREIIRVLQPGGILMTTNRIGKEARWLPGRTYSSETFEENLKDLSLEMVRTQPWQEDYDLVWGIKSGIKPQTARRPLEEILRCPLCGASVTHQSTAYRCEKGHHIPIAPDGIIDFVKAR